MTPAELKSARKSLGLTVKQFASVVGVTRDAVCKWESGARPIPRYVEVIVELLLIRLLRHNLDGLANSTK